MNNYYFSQIKERPAASLEESLRLYIDTLKEIGHHEQNEETYRTYHLLYSEVLENYLLQGSESLQLIIENIVKQIDIRFPWAHGGAKDALGMIGAELSHILAIHSVHRRIDSNEPTEG